MPNYTQYFNITPAVCSTPTVCAAGTCIYFEAGITGLVYLGYGHRVTVTIQASDVLPTRLGAYSNTSGEFAIDFNPPHVGDHVQHDFPLTDTFVEFELQPSTGVDFNIKVEYSQAPGETVANGFCAYGTEPNPSAALISTVTGAVVDAAIIVLGGGALAILAFDTLIGAPLILGDVCTRLPPSVPDFTDADFIPGTQIWAPGSFDKRMQALVAAIWSFYCQCNPAPGGSPAPVSPTAPQPLQLPAATGGTLPAITCDNADLCTSLNAMMRQLTAMNAQIAYIRSDVQLIQRQDVPFSYVLGTEHSGLTGAGDFAVSDILGLSVEFTTIPSEYPHTTSDPPTYFDLGNISVGTAQGWERSYQATKSPFLVLAVSGAVTLVGYTFRTGIVATIHELVREP